MPISRANGLDIYYETAGSGPALVLIHALPFDHNLWLYQVARFSDRFRTVAMDLRGWGRSAKPRAPFTLRDMGDDVMGVLRDEGIDGAVVMGCSIGSKIALMLACDHPDAFRAAILVGGNSGPQNQFDHRIKGYRDNAAAGTLRDYHLGHLRHGVTATFAESATGRYLLDGFVERGAALDSDSIAQVFGALTVSDLTPKLASYKVPTLIVNGEHDSALPGGTRTAGLIRHAEHRILPGAGHCCFLEEPAVFDEYVNDFLRRNGLMSDPAIVSVLQTCRQLVYNQIGVIEASRKLAKLRHELPDEIGDTLLPFVGIDSETDAFPLGDIRQYWAQDALQREDLKLVEAEAYWRELATTTASAVIQHFKDNSVG